MTTYAVTINDEPMPVGDPLNLVSLSVKYNQPRELTISVPRGQWIALNARIVLQIDGEPDSTGGLSDSTRTRKWPTITATACLI